MHANTNLSAAFTRGLPVLPYRTTIESSGPRTADIDQIEQEARMAPIGRFLPVATGRFVEANLSIRAIMSNESRGG